MARKMANELVVEAAKKKTAPAADKAVRIVLPKGSEAVAALPKRGTAAYSLGKRQDAEQLKETGLEAASAPVQRKQWTKQMENYDAWTKEVAAYFKEINRDASARQGKYQDGGSFSDYQKERNLRATALFGEGNWYAKHFSENSGLYDTIYGPGAGKQLADSVSYYTDYLDRARTGLKEEASFWGNFKNERDYRFQLGLDTQESVRAEIDKKNKELADIMQEADRAEAEMNLAWQKPDRNPSEMALTQEAVKQANAAVKEKRGQLLGEVSDLERYLKTIEDRDNAAKRNRELYEKWLAPAQEDPDFEEKAKYQSTANGKAKTYIPVADFNSSAGVTGVPATTYVGSITTESGYDDLEYEYINGEDAEAVKQHRNNMLTLGDGADDSYLKELTPEEKKTYNYWWTYDKEHGTEKHKEFLEDIQTALTARRMEKLQAQWSKYAKEAPLRESVLKVAMMPTRLVSFAGQVADYVDDGEIDINAPYNKYARMGTSIQSSVSELAQKKFGPVGSAAYNIGISMGESLVSRQFDKAVPGLGLFIMGTGAGADAVISAKERGLDDDRAIWLGTIAGLAEIVTEKVSLDKYFELDTSEGFLKSVLYSFIPEATEEGAADVLNFFADTLISQSQAEWTQKIEKYMSENAGASAEEAAVVTFKEMGTELLMDMLAGGISGAISGGGKWVTDTAFEAADNRYVQKEAAQAIGAELRKSLGDEGIEKVISTGLEMGEGTKAYRLASQLQQKLQSGTISDESLGQAVMQIAQEVAGKAEERGTERTAFSQQHIPTYDELIRKPDIRIVDIRSGRSGSISAQRKEFLDSDMARALVETPVKNKDTGGIVFITPATFTHTFSNLGGEQIDAARKIREIVENAVLTHAEESSKAPDDHSTGVYTLFGAVRTEQGIQPVKIKIKEYVLNGQDIPKNIKEYFDRVGTPETFASVYDNKVLTVESIEKEGASSSALSMVLPTDRHPSAPSTITVAELYALVKGDSRKYLPAQEGEQSKTKEGASSSALASLENTSEDRHPSTPSETSIPAQGRKVNSPFGDEILHMSPMGAAQGWIPTEIDPETGRAVRPPAPTMRSVRNGGNVLPTAADAMSGTDATHTPEMQRVMAEYAAAVDPELRRFVQDGKDGKLGKKDKYYLADVSERAAQDIQREIGVDARGFRTVFDASTAAHIENRHGENGAADHSMADVDDIARIQYVLDNYDSLTDSGEITQKVHNSDKSPAKTVVVSKRVDGTYYVVEAVADSNKHEINILSAYKTKATPMAQTASGNIPSPNVRNGLAAQGVAGTSIPAQGRKVNSPFGDEILHMSPMEAAQRAARQNDGLTLLRWTAAQYGVSQEKLERVKRLCELFGISEDRVGWYDSGIEGEGGMSDNENGLILLNARSGDPVAQLLAHEMTHLLENTGHYETLKGMVRSTYTEKQWQRMVDRKEALYNEHAGRLAEEGRREKQAFDAEREIVAQYVAEHLLRDEADIRQLAREHRTIAEFFHDLLDRILAKAGDLAAQDRLFIKNMRDVYRAALQEGRANDFAGQQRDAAPLTQDEVYDKTMGMMQFSIKEAQDGNKFVDVPANSLTGIAEKDIPSALSNIVSTKFFDLVKANGQSIAVSERTVNEWIMSRDAQDLKKIDPIAYSDKVQAFENADELLQASRNYVNEALKHQRKDNFTSFARGNIDFRVNGLGYTGDIIVGITADGKAVLYDIVNIYGKEIAEAPSTTPATDTATHRSSGASAQNSVLPWLRQTSSEDSIFENGANVNDQNQESGEQFSVTDPGQQRDAAPLTQDEVYDKTMGMMQFSIRESLGDDLDAVLNNTFNSKNNEVVIGETSDYLQNKLKAQALRVTMPARKIYAAMVTEKQARADGRYDSQLDYHGLGRDGLIRVLEASENPIAAYVSDRDENGRPRDNRITLVTNETVDGNNAVVIVEVDTDGQIAGKRLAVNKDITAYSDRRVANEIRRAAAQGRLLDFDIRRSQEIAGGQGDNLQDAIRSSDFPKNIEHFWNNVKYLRQKNRPTEFGKKGKPTMAVAFEKAGYISEDKKSSTQNQESGEQFSVTDLGQQRDAAPLTQDEVYDKTIGMMQFAVGETDDGRAVAIVENDILSTIDTTSWNKEKKDLAKKVAKNALLSFKNGIQVNGITYKVNKTSRDEYTRSNDTERTYRKNKTAFADKMRAAAYADDIITATTNWGDPEDLTHERNDNIVNFVHGDVLIQAGKNQYTADTVVGITDAGEYIFYDVEDLNPTTFTMKEGLPSAASGDNTISAMLGSPSVGIVADTESGVKRQNQESGEQFSVTDPEQRREIMENLRGYLDAGDMAGLSSYTRGLSDGSIEPRKLELHTYSQDMARKIVNAAHGQNMSVEEYLQENWEQYDDGGRWNEEAREALQLERQQAGRWQFSVNDDIDSESGRNYNLLQKDARVAWGETDETYTEDNQAVRFTYAIIPAEMLVTSNDASGAANAAYPAELQPRDRTRQSSQMQIARISQNLVPAKLAESPTAQNGAPIIRGDGVVLGGNGRGQAILLAYENGTADSYRQFLEQNAVRFGVDRENLPDNPVLVRVVEQSQNWAELSRKFNESSTQSYSATEQAMADAERMGDILGLLQVDEGIRGLNSPENKDFINAFISKVAAETERNGLITADGLLSQAGLERVQNAIFARAYGDAELSARLSESLDNEIKNVTNALLATAPKAVQLREGIRNGSTYDLNMVDDLLDAVKLYTKLKAEGRTVAQWQNQIQLFDSYSQEAQDIAATIELNKRGAKAITEYINAVYDEVEELGDPNQAMLFEGGNDHVTKRDILDRAGRRFLGSRENGRIGYEPGTARPSRTNRYEQEVVGEVSGGRPENGQRGQEYRQDGDNLQSAGETDRQTGTGTGGQRTVTEPTSFRQEIEAMETESLRQKTTDSFLDDMTAPEPVERRTSAEDVKRLRQQDLDDYWETLQRVGEILNPRTDPSDKVAARTERRETTAGEDIAEAWHAFQRKWVDSGEAVARVGKAVKDPGLYWFFNAARGSSSTAANMVMEKRSNIYGETTGKGLNEILEPIQKKGGDYYRKFQLYLFHMHNVDRMSRYSQHNVDAAQAAFEEFRDMNPELNHFTESQIREMAYDEFSPYYFEAGEYLELSNALNKARNTKNKPVFGDDVTADNSRAMVDRIIRENPEFADMAQEVYDYIDNLMRYRVDSGLITEEDYQKLKSVYPHYVPTFREFVYESTDKRRRNRVQIGSTIKRATGGTEKLIPLHKALAQQTLSVVREGSKNRFGQRLLDSGAERKANNLVRAVTEYRSDFSEDTFDMPEDGLFQKNTFIVRSGGRMWEITLSPAMFEAVQALSPDTPQSNILTKLIRKGNDVFKKLVTSYNPAFLARNFVRDLQDTALYSKDLSEFVKQYPLAVAEIAGGGKYWQQYQALGGVYASIFEYTSDDSAKYGRDGRLKKTEYRYDKNGEIKRGRKGNAKREQNVIGRIEAANMAVEQAPRLAEFMATVKKAEKAHGKATMDDLMEAMYNAAEVTVNFGRSGTLGKKLNADVVPFLNPGIQGFSKMVRTVTETHGALNWLRLIAKASVFGITPTLLNGLLYRKDPDWAALKDRDKDIYYLFKVPGTTTWIKIPKGRVLSLLGMTADRMIDLAKGEDVDWGGFINTALNQVAPANPLNENIVKAWIDAALFDPDNPGRTWYGANIESQRLQQYAPGERYDASTDIISKWLGKRLGLSPKKINYLLDQYSGVVGDIVLPLLTPKAERDMFTAAFTLDSLYSNRYSDDFYAKAKELKYRKNGENATGADAVVYRFWEKKSSEISEINKAIRAVEEDESLTDREKREKNRDNYAMRNLAMREALGFLEQYEQAAEKCYRKSELEGEGDRKEEAYREANREVLGAEYALRTNDRSLYAKAQELKEKNGIDYDAFYDFHFNICPSSMKDAEKYIALADSDFSEEEKKTFAGMIMGTELETEAGNPTQYAKMLELLNSGMSMDDYLKLRAQGTEAVDDYYEYELDSRGLSYEEYTGLKENSAMDEFDKMSDAGLKTGDAYDTAMALENLGEDPSSTAKYLEIARMPYDEDVKASALKSIMSESAFKKYQQASDAGITAYEYCKFLDETAGEKKAGICSYINSMRISAKQKDELYLIAGYAERKLSEAPWHR